MVYVTLMTASLPITKTVLFLSNYFFIEVFFKKSKSQEILNFETLISLNFFREDERLYLKHLRILIITLINNSQFFVFIITIDDYSSSS